LGIARYTLSMWPAMVTSSLIFAAWFVVTLRPKEAA
jgi:hypothetical protein